MTGMNRMGIQKNSFMNHLKMNVLLAPYTTYKIGGPASYFFEPRNLDDFKLSIGWALQQDIPYFVLGGGSNILVHDSGYRGLVVYTGKLNRLVIRGNHITAECGLAVDRLVDGSLTHGLSGIEFAAGLPGTVGGALFMNARAYEGSFSNITEQVLAVRIEKRNVNDVMLKKEELGFSYKNSVFQLQEIYVYSALFSLVPGSKDKIRKEIKANRSRRRENGQYDFPNAGCIFKNDYRIGIPTGKLLEEIGLKGKRIGDAEVYENHANFIINRGNATAEDVYRLIKFIEREVKKKSGIALKREINFIGNWPESRDD
jgi:UDP-N-acetylmuramate dehydrogenase